MGSSQGGEDGNYEWLNPGEIFSTPGDDYSILGMSGGVPRDESNVVGYTPIPILLGEVRNVSQQAASQSGSGKTFMGKAVSPGFLLASGGFVSPRQVATLSEIDSDGDGVSNYIENFNRWNSYRGVPVADEKSVVSMDNQFISSPTEFQEMNCEYQYYLPDSGIGYRFNDFSYGGFLMNLGSWSTVSSIERIGREWHEKYVAGEVFRPYFLVSFMASPKGLFLTDKQGNKLVDSVRTGLEACFPYFSDGSDLAHDFVTSNDKTNHRLDNSGQTDDGFDEAATKALLEMLLKDPDVISVKIDPKALESIGDLALTSHPKIEEVGILDGSVESRRSLDSFMFVEFRCASPVDLDVDSDNNGGYELVEGSSQEEAVENPQELGQSFASKNFGKITSVNSNDADGDGIPDYADATNTTRNIGVNYSNSDEGVETGDLTPMRLKYPPASSLPAGVTEVYVRFFYDASDPSFPTASNGYALPADGRLRVWLPENVQPPEPKFVRNVNPVGAGGDWIVPDTWYSKGELGVSGDEITLFVETVKSSLLPSDLQVKVELRYENSNGTYDSIGSDTVAFTGYEIKMVPDYDRDGKIDDVDVDKWRAGKKFYFWTNTDDDEGETGGSDIPEKPFEPILNPATGTTTNGSEFADAATLSNGIGKISGVKDLIDYFPLSIDLGNMLDVLDIQNVDIKLRGPDLNYALPRVTDGGLAADECGHYLRVVDTARTYKNLEKYRTNGESHSRGQSYNLNIA